MKRLLLASAATLAATAAFADGHSPVKLGVVLGFTGPLESLAPQMAAGAEMAMAEVSDSGLLLDGTVVEPVRGDSTCIDAAAATAATERLITSRRGRVGIVGADVLGRDGRDPGQRGLAERGRHDLPLGHQPGPVLGRG